MPILGSKLRKVLVWNAGVGFKSFLRTHSCSTTKITDFPQCGPESLFGIVQGQLKTPYQFDLHQAGGLSLYYPQRLDPSRGVFVGELEQYCSWPHKEGNWNCCCLLLDCNWLISLRIVGLMNNIQIICLPEIQLICLMLCTYSLESGSTALDSGSTAWPERSFTCLSEQEINFSVNKHGFNRKLQKVVSCARKITNSNSLGAWICISSNTREPTLPCKL